MVSTPPVPPADPGDPVSHHQAGDTAQPPGDVEHDPTGIRALLSALPAPGPMPADLVARINASIAQEQSARAGGTVVPLRRRSWGWQHLGAAAAAAVVLAVGIPALLTGTGPGDVLASLGGRSSSDSAGSGFAASAESKGDAPADSGGAPATAPSTPLATPGVVAPRSQSTGPTDQRVRGAVGNVTLASTGTAYTTSGLATQAVALVTTYDASSAAKDLNGVDGEAGLRACLTALGVQSWLPVRGDVATLDGAPAVIAVVEQGTAKAVYAVRRDCDAEHPSLLAGPVPLP